MRISSKSFFKKKKVVEIKRAFASIIDINDDEGFVYNVRFLADIPEAIKNKVSLVKISTYPDSPIVNSSMFGNSISAKDAIKNVRDYSSRVKDRLKEARSDVMVQKSSDITSRINNEVAKRIFANPQQAERLLGTRVTYTAVNNTKDVKNKKEPILSVAKGVNINPDISLQNSALKAILKDSVDPSSIAEATFPVNTHEASMQGISRYGKSTRRYYPSRILHRYDSKGSKDIKELQHSHENRRHKLSQNAMGIRESLRSIPDVESMPKLSTRVIRKIIKNTFVDINEEIIFPRSTLKNKNNIHFLFELYNSDNAVIDVIHRVVNHNELVEDYLTPDYPPRIYAHPKGPGENQIRISQIDKTATSVKIFRKQIKTLASQPIGRYELIQTIPLSRSDGTVRVIDRVSNTKKCIYMAIAQGPTGRLSSRHRRKVCESYIPPTIEKKVEEELSHVSIFAENIQDHVKVRITNIPEGPVSLYVQATDMSSSLLSRSGKRKSRIVGTSVEEQIVLINKSMLETEVLDFDVKDGHIYEYNCILIYPSGKTEESKTKEVHEFVREKVEAERASLDLTDLTVYVDDNNQVTVTFDVSGTLTNIGVDMIIDSLRAAGIESSFIDEINSSKSELSSILSYWIIRQDEISGLTEDLGVFLGGTFSDDPSTREIKGVSEIQPGRSYRYIVKVLLQSPQTLFIGSSSLAIDSDTSQAFFKSISKYYNPYTLSSGTLPSTASAQGYNVASRISSRDKFIQGRIGLERSIDAVIPSQACNIVSATCSKNSNDKNLISWSISGSQDEIDHFLVMAYYQGIRSTIASVHNLSDKGTYEVIDLELSDEVGEVAYSIIPVYTNYTYGTEVNASSVTTKNREPIFEVIT